MGHSDSLFMAALTKYVRYIPLDMYTIMLSVVVIGESIPHYASDLRYLHISLTHWGRVRIYASVT